MMNSSFEPLHLVNTYGAFGSVTRERREIVIEGTDDERDHGAHRVARVRVQRETGQRVAPCAADRAVSSAARLADVVCGDVRPVAASMVCGAAREAARGRHPDVASAPHEPVSGSPAALRPRGATTRIDSPHRTNGSTRGAGGTAIGLACTPRQLNEHGRGHSRAKALQITCAPHLPHPSRAEAARTR